MSMRLPVPRHANGALRAGEARGDAGDRETSVVNFSFEGEPVQARAGETIGAALWASGRLALRFSPRNGNARGMFCAMGSCQECVVLVGGLPRTACNTLVSPGADVRQYSPNVKGPGK